MLDRRHVGVLRRGRARDRDQRFAGRVRDQMQMEIMPVLAMDESWDTLWIAGEEATAFRPVQAAAGDCKLNLHPHCWRAGRR